jgi:signal peptide peptidase SppA
VRLVDILTSPWAIMPEKLLEIQAIYRTHLRGEKIDISALEAKIGQPLSNEPKPYEVHRGVAVIEMEGIVAKRMSMFTKISGGISTYHVQEQFAAAMADRSVRAILLAIDSPGGGVDGTAELAGMIHSARGDKPIVAFSDGMMASAAYWIGSAADAVYLSGDTARAGSIGIVASHMDISEAEKKMGVKTTEIVAGKYKRLTSRYAPLSKEGEANMQEAVDHVYSAFVADVAKHRGVPVEQVLEQMADGKVFFGRRAVEAGLVDGVSTMEELIHKLSAGEIAAGRPLAAGVVARMAAGFEETEVMAARMQAAEKIKEEKDMPKIKIGMKEIEAQEGLSIDAKWISENCSEIAGSFRLEGAQAERERIKGIEEAALPGYEQIVAEAKADGKSSGADVALKIVKAENKTREKKLEEIRGEAPKPVPAVAVDGVPPPEGKKEKEFMILVDEHQAEKKCSRGEAIKAVAAAHPEAHEKYVAKQQAGSGR